MTREEAKRILYAYRAVYLVNASHIEAFDMAIKALEQQDKVLDVIKEIRDLLKQPATYVPNYDAYGLCLSIICKHMEVEE